MPPEQSLTISILIPAHNEEKMIAACVDSCLLQTRPADQILVVNDGSTDATAEILAHYGEKITVIHNPVASGNKSRAQEIGIEHITSDVFIATDGDTILDSHFIEEIEMSFNEPDVYAVAGYVQSMRHNALTALRELEYVLGHEIYKTAQSHIGYLLVIPGCAAAFRTYLFKDRLIPFEHDTLTEDLDFTYKMHQLGLNIAFNKSAIVYTQDPPTFNSYVNQLRRWYGGGWQNLRKHASVSRYPNAALILSLNYIEGFVLSLLFIVLPFIHLTLFWYLLAFQFFTSVAIGSYAAIIRKRFELFYLSPLRVLIIFVNIYLFLEQFVAEMIWRKQNMLWFHPERHTANITSPS